MPTQKYTDHNGVEVPGVTTILGVLSKPALYRWYYNCGKDGIDPFKAKDTAADIGTIAHYLVECDIKGVKPDLSGYVPKNVDTARVALGAFQEWRKSNDFKVIALEKPYVSNILGFGGCIDIYAELNGKKSLIDIKTSSGVYPEMRVQLAAYKNLMLENGDVVEDQHILRIDKKTGEFCHHRIGELTLEWNLFRALIPVYKMHRNLMSENGKQVKKSK